MLLSEKELEDSSKLHPQILEFFEKNPMPPLSWADYEGMRGAMNMMGQMQLAQAGPANPEVLTEEYITIKLRDGTDSKLKVMKPVNKPAGGSPLVVFAFGGGFIGGDCDQGTAFGRMFVKAFGGTVALVSYRLAPEYKFPTQHLDVWDSLKWIADNATGTLGADPKAGFIMSGASAGGCIASAMVTKAIGEPLAHPFTGQWLAVPTILDDEHTPEKYKKYHLSLKHNKEAPLLNTGSMDDIAKHITGDEDPSKSELRFPILSKNDISKQPKAYFQADGLDPLRDDALIWDEILKEHGVETKVDFYAGCPHAHWAFCPGPEISNKGVVDLIVGVGWLLGQDLSPQDAMTRAL